MSYLDKLTALYAKAQRQMQQFFCGLCTFYVWQPAAVNGMCYGGFTDFDGWEPLADWTEVPCQLAFLQNNPTAAGSADDGRDVKARGRLFLPARPDIAAPPAGSRLRVEQSGSVYWLACSGLVVSYPTHLEAEVQLWPERA